jgi:hypothetical protein
MDIDPHSPLNNTIIFYIMLIICILAIRPKCLYCNKEKKFKPFGYENDKTLFPFSILCISSSILLYMFFSIIDSLSQQQ